MTVHFACRICGKPLEYTDQENELGCAFIICLNCRILGPDVPAVYIIPKGSDLPPEIHDRQFPIVSDEQIPKIYLEYVEQVNECAKRTREKYGQK